MKKQLDNVEEPHLKKTFSKCSKIENKVTNAILNEEKQNYTDRRPQCHDLIREQFSEADLEKFGLLINLGPMYSQITHEKTKKNHERKFRLMSYTKSTKEFDAKHKEILEEVVKYSKDNVQRNQRHQKRLKEVETRISIQIEDDVFFA